MNTEPFDMFADPVAILAFAEGDILEDWELHPLLAQGCSRVMPQPSNYDGYESVPRH